MKTFISVLLILLVSSHNFSFADDRTYLEAMKKNVHIVYTAKSTADLQGAVNALDRIASSEKTRWEPYYYAAFGYIMMATLEQDATKKDAFLDAASAAVEKAKLIKVNESEIVCLEGFIHMIRLTVDPASRGQQYSGLARQAFAKASALNEDNPRALALQAQMQYGTAQFFGTPTTDACRVVNTALEKFETYTSPDPLSPQWGKEMALDLKKECK
jgi:hypothetical protein